MLTIPKWVVSDSWCAMSVAVIGSSGGGTATLGHTEAAELLRTIQEELQKVEDAAGTGGETPFRMRFSS